MPAILALTIVLVVFSLMLVSQNFVSTPIASFMLKREVRKFILSD